MYSSDFLFEKDASEAIGFTCGEDPQNDVDGGGILCQICCLNFFERVHNLYHSSGSVTNHDSERNIEVHASSVQYILMENMLRMSQNFAGKKQDGFPLILVLFEIVRESLHLVDVKANNAKNKHLKNELNYWKHQRKVFLLICENYF